MSALFPVRAWALPSSGSLYSQMRASHRSKGLGSSYIILQDAGLQGQAVGEGCGEGGLEVATPSGEEHPLGGDGDTNHRVPLLRGGEGSEWGRTGEFARGGRALGRFSMAMGSVAPGVR